MKRIEELESKILGLELELQENIFIIWELKEQVGGLFTALCGAHKRIQRFENKGKARI